ncbi:hypothetical protein [Devosia sp.]|uniref:hypothetical protein n=1 Tax=Devosia sp. TaxID=1871048 RepID=UPI003263E786
MNRFLADMLGFLNIVVASAIIAAGALVGYGSQVFTGRESTGLMIGGTVGLIVAAFFCGTIAYLALIEGHLRTIAEYRGGGAGGMPSPLVRQEPRL